MKVNMMKPLNKSTQVIIDKKYSLEEIHALFKSWDEKYGTDMGLRHRRKYTEMFDGYPVKTWSQRYQLFPTQNKCVGCGLQASFYRLEKQAASKLFHFNLYGVKDGEEILFTKDHIIPKSKGGKNHISNYQVMCHNCNEEKGDKLGIWT